MTLVEIPSGIHLAYDLDGPADAQVIVFLHGQGYHRNVFKPYFDHYKTKYRVLSYDLRGHGESDIPRGESEDENRALYTMERMAQDLDELLDAVGLGHEAVVLCGHSLGGYILFSYYFQFKDKVKALIPMGTAAGFEESEQNGFRTFVDGFKNEIDNADAGLSLYDGFIRGLYTKKYSKEHKAELETAISWGRMASLAAITYCTDSYGCGAYDFRDRLDQIDVPVLVVHGDKDGTVSVQHAIEMQEKIPNCTAAIIENGGHLALQENEAEVLAAMDTFLEMI